MRTTIILGLAIGMALSMAPSALAHEGHTEVAVPPTDAEFYVFLHTDDETSIHPHYEVCIGYLCFGVPHLHPHAGDGQPTDVEVWQETNGCDGLQRSAGDCDEDPATETSDEQIL